MKKLFTHYILLVMCISTFAQSPEKMSYQAVIRDASNALVVSQAVGMQISILQGSVTGTPVYIETQIATTNVNGLVTLEIGGGNPVTGTFASIDWSTGSYFIKTETDPTGGTNYTITGTSQILSVPYAFYTKTSESSNDAVKLTGDQTIEGNKTFNGITTVITPVNPTDATNKAYVDVLKAQIQALEDNLIATGTYKVIDIEGNQYKVVKIGDQIWMAENLKVTTYRDGEKIAPMLRHDIYGAYYEWSVVETDKLCPEGWRVPYNPEWEQLGTFLGGLDIAGGKLKATGTVEGGNGLWFSPNTNATNEGNFSALPGGYYASEPSQISSIGYICNWWSKSNVAATSIPYHTAAWMVDYNSAKLVEVYLRRIIDKLTVRCIKDEVPVLSTYPYSNLVVTRSETNYPQNLKFEIGGSILDDRGFEIIQKGVCWNYIGSPEITHEHTIDGSGLGDFTSVISIQPRIGDISYGHLCIRAYATTSKGTGYGNTIFIPSSMWE